MALALKVAGPSAVYYVVPIFGGMAVWLTYVLGARVDGPIAGMIAAVLFAFSPLFLFQTLEPMSDVPVRRGGCSRGCSRSRPPGGRRPAPDWPCPPPC